jgi:hypothetical protein
VFLDEWVVPNNRYFMLFAIPRDFPEVRPQVETFSMTNEGSLKSRFLDPATNPDSFAEN